MSPPVDDGYTEADRAGAEADRVGVDRDRALVEARNLLDAGLISELITDTNSLARSTAALAGELAADRLAREVELRSLRRRNGIAVTGNVLAFIAVLALILYFGGRLTDTAEQNRTNLAAQTFSFLDAAFCVAEHGFDDEAAVYECYADRTAVRVKAQEAADR